MKKLLIEAGTLHSFDKPQDGVVVAYHRDRGETLTPPRRHTYKQLQIEDFNYVFDSAEKKWLVRSYNNENWQSLEEVIAAIDPEKLQA